MSEPKKALIEAAAKKRWPDSIGVTINHRKHTMKVQFGLGRRHYHIALSARSHRELLEKIMTPLVLERSSTGVVEQRIRGMK